MTVAGGPSLGKPRQQPWASPAASCCRLPAWSQLLSSFAATRTTTSEGEGGEAEGCYPCTTTTSAVAETARLCGGAPIEEALLAIRLQPRDAAGGADRALAGLGFKSALDLQLMQAGGPEVQSSRWL